MLRPLRSRLKETAHARRAIQVVEHIACLVTMAGMQSAGWDHVQVAIFRAATIVLLPLTVVSWRFTKQARARADTVQVETIAYPASDCLYDLVVST